MIYDICISFSHVLDVDSADRSDRFLERFCRTLKSSLQNVWRRRGWRFEDIFNGVPGEKKHILKHIKCLSWFMMWGFPFSFELPRVFCDWIFWRSVFHWTFRSCPISMRERTRRKRKTRRKPTHDGDWSLSTCWIALKIGVEVDASQGLHPSPFRKYELENGHQQNEKINICTSPRSQWSDLVDFKTNHERWLVTALPNDAQDNGDAKKASQAGMHASGHLVMGLMAENPMNQSRLVVCSFLIHTSS